MLDFDKPEATVHTLVSRVFHSIRVLKDNSENRILTLMTEAGFVNAKSVGHGTLLVGRIAYNGFRLLGSFNPKVRTRRAPETNPALNPNLL